ncbi:hypothetical protein NEMIN01_2059 [Nematocida minor]|uniref:uncharacterized protein n=1 Tax=Nematocida minor TaxID=1912983 RepID=UPI00221F2C96|nr:uncharacterized protein NEMIN01_2059 [Nematocida minor]KAI5192508.1 hypothetical protein NEMIN01_2059 [Nematocida minor]
MGDQNAIEKINIVDISLEKKDITREQHDLIKAYWKEKTDKIAYELLSSMKTDIVYRVDEEVMKALKYSDKNSLVAMAKKKISQVLSAENNEVKETVVNVLGRYTGERTLKREEIKECMQKIQEEIQPNLKEIEKRINIALYEGQPGLLKHKKEYNDLLAEVMQIASGSYGTNSLEYEFYIPGLFKESILEISPVFSKETVVQPRTQNAQDVQDIQDRESAQTVPNTDYFTDLKSRIKEEDFVDFFIKMDEVYRIFNNASIGRTRLGKIRKELKNVLYRIAKSLDMEITPHEINCKIDPLTNYRYSDIISTNYMLNYAILKIKTVYRGIKAKKEKFLTEETYFYARAFVTILCIITVICIWHVIISKLLQMLTNINV